jgi:hypothetical protein
VSTTEDMVLTPIPDVSPTFKDWTQVLAWIAAVVGVAIAFTKGRTEVRENRLQRARELRWRQASAGREIVNEMLSDEYGDAALTMLDWSGREYEIAPGHQVTVTHADYVAALRVDNLQFADKEQYTRDCFDTLFYYMGTMEHLRESGLVGFDDVVYPLDYYANRMREDADVFRRFLDYYRLTRERRFFDRLLETTAGQTAATGGQRRPSGMRTRRTGLRTR